MTWYTYIFSQKSIKELYYHLERYQIEFVKVYYLLYIYLLILENSKRIDK